MDKFIFGQGKMCWILNGECKVDWKSLYYYLDKVLFNVILLIPQKFVSSSAEEEPTDLRFEMMSMVGVEICTNETDIKLGWL